MIESIEKMVAFQERLKMVFFKNLLPVSETTGSAALAGHDPTMHLAVV